MKVKNKTCTPDSLEVLAASKPVNICLYRLHASTKTKTSVFFYTFWGPYFI